jgi:hypothetical protein
MEFAAISRQGGRIGLCRGNLAYRSSQDSKKNELQPHLKRTRCLGKLDSRFLARMETILALYALPYDPEYPVVCFDERPCFLIGDEVGPLTIQSGQVHKEHYAYEKLGSYALLAAIEPLIGRRIAQVHPQRTNREFCPVFSGPGRSIPIRQKDPRGAG